LPLNSEYQFKLNRSQVTTATIEGRVALLRWLLVVLLVILVVNLFAKQVIGGSKYKAMAKDQQTAKLTSQPERGKIYAYDKTASDFGVTEARHDKQFFPLATNIMKFDVWVVPRNLKNPEETAKILAEKLSLDANQLLPDFKSNKLYIPPIIKRIDKIKAEEIANLNLRGVITVPSPVRFYPEGTMAAQLIGFVNYDGEGSSGIENYYNNELKGVPGVVYGLKDTKGRVIGVNDQTRAQNGVDLVLTIDSTVQFIAETKLKEAIEKYGATGGTIIIAEPDTGRVLAMANNPSFDPNKFNEVPKEQQSLYINPAISDVYEPGSIFKPMIMAAAIDAGKVEPDTKPEDLPGGFNNMVTIDGYEIHNSQDKAFGFETMTKVLENSDNIGMIWVADRMGNDIMGKYIKDFGIGAKTGIDAGAEGGGKMSDPAKWRNVNRATISFGQGISATPIQIISAYMALANDGKLVKPHLLDTIISASGEEKKIETTEVRQVIKKETADKIKEMLVSVVENGHGKKAKVDGFRVAGKTGTAQIPKKDGPGYEEEAHIGSFAGFAPADDPKFVMMVKLDRPSNVEWAESSAAPTFGEIAKWLLTNYYR
jgi:cell division protein FtsI/penicillin-binding protein 2